MNALYPAAARDNGIQGTVLMSTMIDREGYFQNTCIVKGVHDILDTESMRLMGYIHRIQPIRIEIDGEIKTEHHLNVPISFTLR